MEKGVIGNERYMASTINSSDGVKIDETVYEMSVAFGPISCLMARTGEVLKNDDEMESRIVEGMVEGSMFDV